jgi:hypothetical protein
VTNGLSHGVACEKPKSQPISTTYHTSRSKAIVVLTVFNKSHISQSQVCKYMCMQQWQNCKCLHRLHFLIISIMMKLNRQNLQQFTFTPVKIYGFH